MSSKDCKDKAGSLRHRIVIEQVARAGDGVGGSVETWSTFATVWAKVSPVSAGQQLWAESLRHKITHRVLLRYLSGVASDMRISFDGRTLQITGFRHLDENEDGDGKVWTALTAAEGVPT
jgi:SPP1 family predicted phage head-tail adaptor